MSTRKYANQNIIADVVFRREELPMYVHASSNGVTHPVLCPDSSFLSLLSDLTSVSLEPVLVNRFQVQPPEGRSQSVQPHRCPIALVSNETCLKRVISR